MNAIEFTSMSRMKQQQASICCLVVRDRVFFQRTVRERVRRSTYINSGPTSIGGSQAAGGPLRCNERAKCTYHPSTALQRKWEWRIHDDLGPRWGNTVGIYVWSSPSFAKHGRLPRAVYTERSSNWRPIYHKVVKSNITTVIFTEFHPPNILA